MSFHPVYIFCHLVLVHLQCFNHLDAWMFLCFVSKSMKCSTTVIFRFFALHPNYKQKESISQTENEIDNTQNARKYRHRNLICHGALEIVILCAFHCS